MKLQRLAAPGALALPLALALLYAAAPLAHAQDVYEHMRLVDLKGEQKNMIGEKVVTSGLVEVVGEMIMLQSEPVDTAPLSLNITRLRSDDKRQVLTRCATPCRVDVAGSMVDGPHGLELRADGIEIK